MGNAYLIEKAANMIESVKGRKLSINDRKKLAVELAAIILNESKRIITKKESRHLKQIARMVSDPLGKVFTARVCDECFRSHDSRRVADQLVFTLKDYGIPKFVPLFKKIQLASFMLFGPLFPSIFVPLAKKMLRMETSNVILPGEYDKLAKHMVKRNKEGVRINLNHLGEAILGEEEAKHRQKTYLEDLTKPEIDYISVKISTIYSQINLLAWEETVEAIADKLRCLYRKAIEEAGNRLDGVVSPKFVNLDMEEYRDLFLTVEVFKRVLDEPEFRDYYAGIVLQAYLPDSAHFQKELTEWALKRVAEGGAPIKIRLVKGANLAMEQVEASVEGWPQAPYTNKHDVDANYKKMMTYGMKPEHTKAVKLGIASHNLFDIAYALLLRSEYSLEKDVCFEMLEGMAESQRRAVQELCHDVVLYCPSATKSEFVNAVAYLVRRLDENTAPENFLRHSFDLVPGTDQWNKQVKMFDSACEASESVTNEQRRQQNRSASLSNSCGQCAAFDNEPNTDWALPANRSWVEKLLKNSAEAIVPKIPLVIGGEEIYREETASDGVDPSKPGKVLYRYTLADDVLADKAVTCAVEAAKKWSAVPIEERVTVMRKIASGLREKRGLLIQAMIADGGKTIPEADVEISEAIDFAEYYLRNAEELYCLEDIEWQSKGVVMVTPPWNFPCAIPFGGVAAALLGGNSVLFKPARETVLVAWHVAQICWEAGVGRDVLQFIVCEDDPVGSQLIKDTRINSIILTGATETAELFFRMRPGLDLSAETGGKNAMIVSRLSDRDLAIKDIIKSAFGHAGQKCSACSLLILEKEVYDDIHFREQLRDAVKSLSVGSAWNPKTKISPLIMPPGKTLLRGLTTLEEGEDWLLEPKQDVNNPNLWSPGIKFGVKKGSFGYENEFFGPVLGVMCAESVEHAIGLANGTRYGLTSGIHSLDTREQQYWMAHIEAGNLYINRGITGAVVQRQPFGGCKASSFGHGAKAGGPNYLMQMMIPKQKELPKEREPVSDGVSKICKKLEKTEIDQMALASWNAAVGSYAFFWNHYFSKDSDPSQIIGQDNLLRYVPRKDVVLRCQDIDSSLDILQVICAAVTCHCKLELSLDASKLEEVGKIVNLHKIQGIKLVEETEEIFIQRVEAGVIRRVRLISTPSSALKNALGQKAVNVIKGPVLANGRIELLNYLREISISFDYHRYGNLGRRENEERKPLPLSPVDRPKEPCKVKCCSKEV